ncbi:MAG: hypothetical protein D3923_03095 [Candidatus Electrothrix sp. AR3]|nr:hypothetical protein [Candidatus Electrothrix sp. AR3]
MIVLDLILPLTLSYQSRNFNQIEERSIEKVCIKIEKIFPPLFFHADEKLWVARVAYIDI